MEQPGGTERVHKASAFAQERADGREQSESGGVNHERLFRWRKTAF